jgi:NADPH-dependent curcumin reductase CurA
MSLIPDACRQIVLASRPTGAPVEANFRIQEAPLAPLAPGQVLLRTVYLSIDPYMRGRMSDEPSYAAPVEIDGVMVGGTVSRVIASRNPAFVEGDRVLGYTGWQTHAVSDGSGLSKLPADLAHPSYALGVLGMPGFTAYRGLTWIGEPKAGETVVVAAATGAVGAVVGQIAKILGCRVVGIAGGAKKCRYAVEELGFDACIDHHGVDLPERLKAACLDGIDVYFENVGGAVFEAVMPLLSKFARVPVCGLIAQYNASHLPDGPDRFSLLARTVLTKSIRMQGFIIFDSYADHYAGFVKTMGGWLAEGRVKTREDRVDGLENAPKALIGLLEGRNFGKLIVRVSED